MADKKKSHEFSCDNCGSNLIAYPPDGMYTNFFVNRCCEKSLKRLIECDNCNHKNKRFWCYSHTVIASSGFHSSSSDPLDDYFNSRSLY